MIMPSLALDIRLIRPIRLIGPIMIMPSLALDIRLIRPIGLIGPIILITSIATTIKNRAKQITPFGPIVYFLLLT